VKFNQGLAEKILTGKLHEIPVISDYAIEKPDHLALEEARELGRKC